MTLYRRTVEHAHPTRYYPSAPAPQTPKRSWKARMRTPESRACDADACPALFLALTAVRAACTQLDRYAQATDCPAWQVIDAADLLEAAHDLLVQRHDG